MSSSLRKANGLSVIRAMLQAKVRFDNRYRLAEPRLMGPGGLLNVHPLSPLTGEASRAAILPDRADSPPSVRLTRQHAR